MLNDIRLTDLRTFQLVARHGGFSAAARVAGCPQTTVSKRMASLEHALGVKLLHRTTRLVHLTDDGKRVYEWAQRMLDTATEMEDELNAAKNEPQGPLRVSTSTRLGRAYVAPVLARLKTQYPSLEISLDIVDRHVDLMAEGLHLDVRTGEPHEPHLIRHHIMESSRILCAAPSYVARHGMPTSLSEVRSHRCLLFKDRNEPLGVWRLKGPKGWESVDIRSETESNDNEVVLDWARRGLGIMLATDWFLADNLEQGDLQRVLPDWHQPADVWAVSASRTAQSAKVRVFIECLREAMQARRQAAHRTG